jgi:hypothetical protein
MTGDKNLNAAVGRIEGATTEIRAEQATQATLLRGIDDMLRDVLKAVTPEEGADPGVPLDELLARLVIELREQGKKLDAILLILQGPKSPGGDKATAAAPANGSGRGARS